MGGVYIKMKVSLERTTLVNEPDKYAETYVRWLGTMMGIFCA